MNLYQTIITILFTFVLFKDFAMEGIKRELSLNLFIRGFMVVAFPYILNWFQKI